MKAHLTLLCFLGIGFADEAPRITELKTNTHNIRVGGPKLQLLSPSKQKGGELVIRGEFRAKGFNLEEPYTFCGSTASSICLQWQNEEDTLTLEFKEDEDSCIVITGEGGSELTWAHPYYDYQWYGGPERYQQEWPIQTLKTDDLEPYITRQTNNQGVLESFWFSSDGTSIRVTPNATLFFGSNMAGSEGELTLTSKIDAPYQFRNSTYLQQYICNDENPVEAYYRAVKKYLGKPVAHPGKRMMTFPTYSTWAKYKSNIDQDKVVEFTNQILDHGYLMGQIEIDDKWETCYGSLTFDTGKFPNITQLTDYIHSKGGRATAWVHPFININCDLYKQAVSEGRLIKNEAGNMVSFWWNGAGGVVDVTNQTTKDWWVGRLKDLQKTSGLDGFKFDAGETSWLPQLPVIIGDPMFYPESYVRNYVEAAAEFGEDLEVRVGHQTQDVPLFVRMLDKDSKWGLDNGLQSVITTAFQIGLNGYPFILPDMIGGNAYGEFPTKELFIRWVEASALLPAMQFSLLPWDYDEETSNISRQYLDLHTYYSQALLDASDLTLSDGRPIITPIWWYAPEDPETYPIRDQYMTGDSLLVAPVLEDGKRYRDIYLPNGTWVDARQATFEGPTWLRNYSAPLDYLPLFTKMNIQPDIM